MSSRLGRKRKVTIVDVAESAGVSVSAVSRAFNPSASISVEMRTRVFEAADRLNYKPNRLARAIKSSSSLIAILVTDFNNPFYIEVLEAFTSEIQKHNFHCLLVNVNERLDIGAALDLVMEYRVDGLIVTSASLSDELLESCVANDVPVVIFGRGGKINGKNNMPILCDNVTCDNFMAGSLAADLILDAGYNTPAFVSGPRNASVSLERQRGFVHRLVSKSCPNWQIIEGGDFSYQAGYEAMIKLFQGRERPDSVFFADDIMACGGIDAIKYVIQLDVPNDVGIVGVDDIQLSSSPAYNLTTIQQPYVDMVKKTIELLFRRIEDISLLPQSSTLPCVPIKRGSLR